MSTSGLTNQFIPSTLDGLVVINADAIAINGQDIDIDSLVPYTGANKTTKCYIIYRWSQCSKLCKVYRQ